MSLRELVVLGTASQVPTRYRNHNGYLLRWDGEGILFDPGEGTQRQMIRAQVSVTNIHRICITHFHGDHCLGLPGIIQRISLDEVPHEVKVHYPQSGQVYFDRLRHASIFQDKSHITPMPIPGDGELDTSPRLALSAMNLDHSADAYGFRVQEPDRWKVDSQELAARSLRGPIVRTLLERGEIEHDGATVRREDIATLRKGQSLAFIMDTRMCDAAHALADGVDMLVCESTYLAAEQRQATEHGHMTAQDAGKLAATVGARKLVLTHFSQRYRRNEDFATEARQFFDHVVAAEDGLRIPVPPRDDPA